MWAFVVPLHQPVKKHVFNVRTKYQREAEKAVAYLASTGVTRVALVQTDDSFGADGATGVLNGLAAVGLKLVATSNAQAVVMVAPSDTVVKCVSALKVARSVGRWSVGTENSNDERRERCHIGDRRAPVCYKTTRFKARFMHRRRWHVFPRIGARRTSF